MSGEPGGSLLRELALGRRGVGKAVHVWLPVGTLVAAAFPGSPGRVLAAAAGAFVAAACFTQVSILLNDIADVREDRAAGKERWITRLPVPAAVALLGLVAALGGAALGAAGAGGRAIAIYGASLALGVAYSLPPLRLKTRGLAGPLAYAAAAAGAYALVPAAALGGVHGAGGILAAVVFADKLVHLLHHQVADRGEDAMSGLRTFAVEAGADRARRALRRSAWLAILSFTALALALLLWGRPREAVAAAGIVAAGAAAAAWAAGRPWVAAAPFSRELPAAYLGAAVAGVRVLPVVLLAAASVAEPALLPLAPAAAATAAVELASYRRGPRRPRAEKTPAPDGAMRAEQRGRS